MSHRANSVAFLSLQAGSSENNWVSIKMNLKDVFSGPDRTVK
jgi:hypothetical protein